VFHRFLLSFDINQQTPTEALYTKPLATSDVLAVYDMSGPAARLAFNSMVVWDGSPDTRPLPPSVLENAGVGSVEGFDCYAALFQKSVRGDAVCRLGANPWAAAVAVELLDNPDLWSRERFQLQLGMARGPRVNGTESFVQAHVFPSESGLSVRQLLPFLTGPVRLGATDLAAALSIAEQSETPAVKSAFDLRPKGSVHTMRFSVYGIVGADVKKYPSIAFSPLSAPALALILGVYESVRLESAGFTITVDKGSANSVWCAMVTAGTTLKSEDDWYSAPIMATIDGSDTGVVRGRFDMPAITGFSREYRASTIGNPPAKFVFSYTGSAETSGRIEGMFVVSVSGQRLINRINMGGSSPVTSMKNLVHSVHGELEYEVDDCDVAPRTTASLGELSLAGVEDEE